MVQEKGGFVGRQLEELWTSGTLTGMSDAQLVGRFTSNRDSTAESAFRELVHRHGPMVMGVCRQILRRAQDAEDAFQATFLILVRKARSVQVGDTLAPWLYGVAYRTAQRARASGSRYRQGDPEQLLAIKAEPVDVTQFDLRPVLQEELGRLPEKYRSPIVLCHLEGKTHEEAARMLRWPIGTVSGRLSRGRELLKSRLERRGLAVPSLVLASSSWSVSQPLPETLVASTVSMATHSATAQTLRASVVTLSQGVLRAMLLDKMKTVSLAILVVAGASGGAMAWARRTPLSVAQTEQKNKTTPAAKAPQRGGAPIGDGFSALKPTVLKNSPSLADFRDPIPVFGTGSIVMVESPDGSALEARSVNSEDSAWQKLTIPGGIRATPIAAEDTLALMYEGESIEQLAAFSAETGKWSTIQLAEPVHDAISPVIGPGSAVYQAGNTFYAFSAQKGAWDILRLPKDPNANAKPRASVAQTYVCVQQGDRLYVFSLKHGRWSEGATMKLRPITKKAAEAKTPAARP